MHTFTPRELPALALALAAVLAPACYAFAQRGRARGTLEVRVTTGHCGTCAMPPGSPEPAPGVSIRVFRDESRRGRTQVTDGGTNAAGVARFALRPGRYCVEAGSPGTALAPRSRIDGSEHCEDVTAGRTAYMQLDVRACPELRCTGMER